jgi:hypothetical protein
MTSCKYLKKKAMKLNQKYRVLVLTFKPDKNSVRNEKRVTALGKKIIKISNQLKKRKC